MGTSKISEIYDKLVTIVGDELSTYKRLTNPYISGKNNELILQKSFGIGIGPGTRLDLGNNCSSASYERVFSLVLVNLVAATDHDITTKSDIEKSLVEDFISINNLMERNVTLDNICIDSVYKDDSGIEFLDGDKEKYVMMNINYTIKYEELTN